jgi:hypothetical protein
MIANRVQIPLESTSDLMPILQGGGYGVLPLEGPRSTDNITMEVFLCSDDRYGAVLATVTHWNDGRESPTVTLSTFRKHWRFWLRGRDARLVTAISTFLLDQGAVPA